MGCCSYLFCFLSCHFLKDSQSSLEVTNFQRVWSEWSLPVPEPTLLGEKSLLGVTSSCLRSGKGWDTFSCGSGVPGNSSGCLRFDWISATLLSPTHAQTSVLAFIAVFLLRCHIPHRALKWKADALICTCHFLSCRVRPHSPPKPWCLSRVLFIRLIPMTEDAQVQTGLRPPAWPLVQSVLGTFRQHDPHWGVCLIQIKVLCLIGHHIQFKKQPLTWVSPPSPVLPILISSYFAFKVS